MSKALIYGSSDEESIKYESRNVAIVGANGSGKTSLMRRIGQHTANVVVISAHKNLTIRQGSHRGQDKAWLINNWSHFEGPSSGGRLPGDNNAVQSDFNQLIEMACREYIDESVKAFHDNKTPADIVLRLQEVFKLWNSIFTDRELSYNDNKIQVKVKDQENYYDIEHLSDGERVVLYVLLKVATCEQGSLIVIDEPETFLNPALLNTLFDECEKLKMDSDFVYFSHDLEFVTSLKNSTLFWIKNFEHPTKWEVLPVDATEVPEELILKVIGSKKKKILFVESEENKDTQLYQLIYPDFKVWGVGGCDNVVTYTKAFNSRTEKFSKEYYGLIDRDLRSHDEVVSLEANKVFSLPVAIYENLFFRKELVKFVFEHLGRTDFIEKMEAITEAVKIKVAETNFKKAYTKSKIQRQFNLAVNDLVETHGVFSPDYGVADTGLSDLAAKSYEEILMEFNQKDIKGCASCLGYTWLEWHTQVLNIFNTLASVELQTVLKIDMPQF